MPWPTDDTYWSDVVMVMRMGAMVGEGASLDVRLERSGEQHHQSEHVMDLNN